MSASATSSIYREQYLAHDGTGVIVGTPTLLFSNSPLSRQHVVQRTFLRVSLFVSLYTRGDLPVTQHVALHRRPSHTRRKSPEQPVVDDRGRRLHGQPDAVRQGGQSLEVVPHRHRIELEQRVGSGAVGAGGLGVVLQRLEVSADLSVFVVDAKGRGDDDVQRCVVDVVADAKWSSS